MRGIGPTTVATVIAIVACMRKLMTILNAIAQTGNFWDDSLHSRLTRKTVARTNRLSPRTFDQHLYKSHYLVECFFNRIKQFRRIAMRHDELAASFLSFVHLACAFGWLA